MNKNVQYVDLSRMLYLPKCAVICRTQEEIELFHVNALEQLGERYAWDMEQIMSTYEYYECCTGYTLFANYDKLGNMSWCKEEWFLQQGYELVYFADLANPKEIDESEMPIDILLNIGALR